MLTETLLPLLRPLIGIRPDPLDNYEAESLPESLMKTTTGLTLDQCHDLLQLSTLRKTGPLDVVDFPAYLARIRDNAIRALLTNLDTRLVETSLSPRLLKPTVLFSGLATTQTPIVASGRVVGLQFMTQQADVAITLDRVRFGFATDQVPLAISDEYGRAWSVPIDAANEWADVGMILMPQRTYRLTYNEGAIPAGQLVYQTVSEWPKSATGCRGCKTGCLSHYVRVDGVSNGIVSRADSFGLNVVLSATGDVTNRLADDPRRLITALRQQMAVTFLEQIAYSTRKNGPTEEAKQGALFALTDKDNADRVTLKLDRALSALVKALAAEASAGLDTNTDDEITWGSL